MERKRLEEEVGEQQRLIDALSAETMTLREEIATLQVRERQSPVWRHFFLIPDAELFLGLSKSELRLDLSHLHISSYTV